MAIFSLLIRKTGSYAFDKEAILGCWKVAQDFLGKAPDLSISFEDNITIQGKEPQEILDDIYLKSKLIDELKIEGLDVSTDPTKLVELSFGTAASRQG